MSKKYMCIYKYISLTSKQYIFENFSLTIVRQFYTLPHTATHCYTLPHIATHCYTLIIYIYINSLIDNTLSSDVHEDGSNKFPDSSFVSAKPR